MSALGEIWERVTAEQALLTAWTSVRRNALADGEPGTEVEAFEQEALTRLSTLAEALSTGTWVPGELRRVVLEGGRTLELSTIADRVLERSLTDHLTPMIDPLLSPSSFAYRPGLGVDDAVEALRGWLREGRAVVLRADVRDCFDEIPRWPVISRLQQVTRDQELVNAVAALLNRRVAGRSARPRRRGLHQGSPLAPLLANLYLDELDQALAAQGMVCIRYADDLAMPLAEGSAAPAALELLQQAVRGLALELNETKTLVVPVHEGVPFLGRVVTADGADPGSDLGEPLRGSLYVDTPGALLRSRGERLRVEVGGERTATIHLKRVEQIVCVGRVGTTTAFLHQAGRAGTDLLFVGHDGVVSGRYTGNTHRGVALPHAQHLMVEAEERRDAVARDMVIAKVLAMRAALSRWRTGQPRPLRSAVDPYLAAVQQAHAVRGRMSLMGVEGAASRRYFAGLSDVLGPDWAFTQRRRRPPPDAINAMLSFGYTLLANEAETAALEAGLDPDVGFLHTPRDGRRALALDLMEEFRILVVDAAVVRMAGTRQVAPADFTIDERGCRMGDAARSRFLHAFERRLLTLHGQAGVAMRLTYRESLRLQARRLADVVRGRADHVPPVGWR